MLEHGNLEVPVDQVADGESGQGAVVAEVGAQQRARGADGGLLQQRLQEARRQMQDADRAAGDCEGAGDPVDSGRVGRQRQVADPAAGGDASLREVGREPLLQLAGGG